MADPLRADPTQTTTLRRRFESELRGRFNRLKGKIRKLIVEEDAFGLKRDSRNPFTGTSGEVVLPQATLATNQRWAFRTNAQKVEAFQQWLQSQIQLDILEQEVERIERAYWEAYIQEGFRKGAGRAFDQVRKPATSPNLDFYQGTKDEFLRSAFGRPETVDKVKLLAGRVLTDLKGVTDTMSTQMTRVLTDGLVQGRNPRDIARDLNRVIDNVGKRRAETIARTEVIRAHAEGQLDSLEKLGVEKVGVAVEWSTAGDDRVCPLCAALEGIVLKTKEAHSLIPRHPNCRCAFVPANVGEDQKGQVRAPSAIEERINRSIKLEIPKRSKRTLAEQKRVSRWAGADRKINKTRPKSVLDKPKPKEKPKPKPTKKPTKKPTERKPERKPPAPKPKKQPTPKPVKKPEPKPPAPKPKPKPPAPKPPAPKPKPPAPKPTPKPAPKPKPRKPKTVQDKIQASKELEGVRQSILNASTKFDKEINEARAKYQAVKQETAKLQKEYKTLSDDLQKRLMKIMQKKIPGDDPKYRAMISRQSELVEEIAKLNAEGDTMSARFDRIQKQWREEVVKSFQVAEGSRSTVKMKKAERIVNLRVDRGGTIETIQTLPSRGAAYKRKLEEAEEFLSGIIPKRENAEKFDTFSHALPAGTREFQRNAGNRPDSGIYLSELSPTRTFVHEIGHLLEQRIPNANRLAQEFRDYRIKKSNKPWIKMADLCPECNYGPNEVGNPDDWEKLFGTNRANYIGKGYSSGDTEVISMGLEQLYQDPVKFAKEDPEYFKFIIGVMRGIL